MDTWSSETITPLYQDCLLDRELDCHSNFMQQSQYGNGEDRLALAVPEISLPGREASATGPYNEPVKTSTHDPF